MSMRMYGFSLWRCRSIGTQDLLRCNLIGLNITKSPGPYLCVKWVGWGVGVRGVSRWRLLIGMTSECTYSDGLAILMSVVLVGEGAGDQLLSCTNDRRWIKHSLLLTSTANPFLSVSYVTLTSASRQTILMHWYFSLSSNCSGTY